MKESSKLAKAGIEVEGFLRGKNVLTLFVTAEEVLGGVLHKMGFNEIPIFEQIYISDPNSLVNVSQAAYDLGDSLLRRIVGAYSMVTVCAPKFAADPCPQVSLVLSVSVNESFNILRDLGHEIKFEMPDGGCWVFHTADGVYTDPKDFGGDVGIVFAE